MQGSFSGWRVSCMIWASKIPTEKKRHQVFEWPGFHWNMFVSFYRKNFHLELYKSYAVSPFNFMSTIHLWEEFPLFLQRIRLKQVKSFFLYISCDPQANERITKLERKTELIGKRNNWNFLNIIKFLQNYFLFIFDILPQVQNKTYSWQKLIIW